MPQTAQKDRRERQKAETRAELLVAAHALVREQGYDGLTIRKLAERIGYAPMSVYSYFPDKHSILLAIAQDAYAELAKRMQRDAPKDPLDALRTMMRAYAAFGLENPNEYRIVFMTPEPTSEKLPEEMTKQNPALLLLLARVGACIESGAFAGDIHAIASVLWTFGHGTVSLLLSFPHYPFGDRDAYIERTIELAIAALRSAPVAPLKDIGDC